MFLFPRSDAPIFPFSTRTPLSGVLLWLGRSWSGDQGLSFTWTGSSDPKGLLSFFPLFPGWDGFGGLESRPACAVCCFLLFSPINAVVEPSSSSFILVLDTRQSFFYFPVYQPPSPLRVLFAPFPSKRRTVFMGDFHLSSLRTCNNAPREGFLSSFRRGPPPPGP